MAASSGASDLIGAIDQGTSSCRFMVSGSAFREQLDTFSSAGASDLARLTSCVDSPGHSGRHRVTMVLARSCKRILLIDAQTFYCT